MFKPYQQVSPNMHIVALVVFNVNESCAARFHGECSPSLF